VGGVFCLNGTLKSHSVGRGRRSNLREKREIKNKNCLGKRMTGGKPFLKKKRKPSSKIALPKKPSGNEELNGGRGFAASKGREMCLQ